ncbi:hypothetical protein M9Y10_003117 [Tritrichomonas musculus]|uniref:Ankyrin repeat protein n=1 Tax=Tritrichomonas musculus TaxID=1915356 RepID=A0ABR2JPT3_9EUKA
MVKHLLSISNINPNLYDRNNVTPLIAAISRFNIEIVNIFIDYFGDNIKKQMWQFNDGLRKILHIVSRKTSNTIKGRRGYPRESSQINADEDEWSNFISNNQAKISAVIHRLIEIEDIDLNCHIKNCTLLCYACETNDIDLLNALLDSNKIDINSVAPSTGNTPLMVAIERSNVNIAEILIKNPLIEINHRNLKDQTALTIAVTNQLTTIVSLLINHPKFDPEESFLDYSFFISSKEIAKQLYEDDSLDINYINTHSCKQEKKTFFYYYDDEDDFYQKKETNQYETALIHAVNQNQLELVDMIVKHPLFDPVKSQVNEAIFASVENNSTDIFEYLLKLVNNDVNIYNQRHQSLLFYTIICDNKEFFSKILNSDTFDSHKSDILDSFIKASYLNCDFTNQDQNRKIEFSARIDIMDELLDYDENHFHLINMNNLLPNGKSFFTSINCDCQNLEDIVQYYLVHGVDPNMPDSFGVYPLEYAILNRSYCFFRNLLNSNRIDMSVRLKKNNQTYLHLAAVDSNMFKDIYNRNQIDINVKDDLGETPLMKVCTFFDVAIWIILFKDDNLDYKHRNNIGEDALDIVKRCYLFKKNKRSRFNGDINLKAETPNEKRQYLVNMIKYV